MATPGRLKDLIERGDCRLDQVAITVLDEADQMADMGFMPQVTALLKQVEPDGQRMLFSATLDKNIDRLVKMFLTDPVVHSVDPSAGAVTTMEHHVLHVADETDKKAVATQDRRPRRPGDPVRGHQARLPTGSPSGCWPAAYGPPPCTADSPSRSATGPSTSSRTARSPRSWRPTSPPAASTSTTSTWS